MLGLELRTDFQCAAALSQSYLRRSAWAAEMYSRQRKLLLILTTSEGNSLNPQSGRRKLSLLTSMCVLKPVPPPPHTHTNVVSKLAHDVFEMVSFHVT